MFISNMKMSQLRYHTVQCSKSQQHINIKTRETTKSHKDTNKDSWGSYSATGSEITEKEQLPCNTHLNSNLLWHDYIISPTRHREIVESELHPEIDTKRLIRAKTQMERVLIKKSRC